MPDSGVINHLVQTIRRLRFLRGSLVRVFLWPIVGLALGMALWGVTSSRIEADKRALKENALKEVTSLTHAYAQYVAGAIEQADQIALQVKYNWEHSHGKVNLEELSQKGVFRSSSIIRVSIINRNGLPITGTDSGSGGQQASQEERNYFLFHKNDKSDVLLIGKPVSDGMSGRPVIEFTRRLNAADGSFAGVVLICVESNYFTSFYAGQNPGKNGLLAAVGNDGTLRAAKIGSTMQQPAPPALSAIPLFNSPEGSGFLAGEPWFGDKQARFVAWETLKSQPLTVIAGLTEEEFLAPYQETWVTYRHITIAGSILLFLSSLVAMVLSARLAWKRHQEEEVRKAYRIATEGGNDGFYMFDAVYDSNRSIMDFKVVDCNERGADFYGLKKAELIGTKLSTRYSGSYFDLLMNTFRSAMQFGFYDDEVELPPDSQIKIRWVKRKFVRSGNGLAVTLQDITERKMADERLAFMAHHDQLTHLPNRLLLRDRFDQAVAIAAREETGIAMLFLDLDNFKHVNDAFGHQVGDQLLLEIVKRLQGCIRDIDTICRQGGDEFILLLPNINDINAISRIAQNILDAVAEPVEVGGHTFGTSASIGISLFPNDGSDFETLLKNADTAMYHIKGSGRNGYRFFTEKMNTDTVERMNLLTQLRNALGQKELVLHYQPQINLVTGNVIGTEALIRWKHPQLGMISPARFIPLAEDSGLIIGIGEWVLEEACRQARMWMDSGLPPNAVAVNLSALQFQRGNILETVSKALDRSGLPPGLLELELTESILLQDMDTALKTIHELKVLGVKLSIDDFGTGYSSLSYLKRLEVDKLKIDQSFVRDLVEDADDLAIVCAIIQLGKALELSLIAEGVETIEQLRQLKKHRCDEAQGYYISRPLPVEELTPWLLTRN